MSPLPSTRRPSAPRLNGTMSSTPVNASFPVFSPGPVPLPVGPEGSDVAGTVVEAAVVVLVVAVVSDGAVVVVSVVGAGGVAVVVVLGDRLSVIVVVGEAVVAVVVVVVPAQWSSFAPPLFPCSSQSCPFVGCGSGTHVCPELPWLQSPCPGGAVGGSAAAEMASTIRVTEAMTNIASALRIHPSPSSPDVV